MSRPKVCIYRPVDASGASHRRLMQAGCELAIGPFDGVTSAELAELASGADALLGATYRDGIIGPALLAELPRLRIVAKYTVGVDDVDVDFATARGIVVTHCPTEANWGAVAEWTIAAMLALLKRVRERDRQVKAGGWRDSALRATYLGARQDGYPGVTVGIIGLGRIGTRVADLLAPWRVTLLACDPYVEEAKFVHHGVRPVDLRTLLESSDVVTLHCDLRAETRGLIGPEQLGWMKPGAVLINTARGALVDVEALEAALRADRLMGAALDVLVQEPPAAGSRLLEMGDKLLLSPHMANATTGNPLEAAVPWATEAVLSALRGEVPRHVCNTEAIPRWRERFAGKPLI